MNIRTSILVQSNSGISVVSSFIKKLICDLRSCTLKRFNLTSLDLKHMILYYVITQI